MEQSIGAKAARARGLIEDALVILNDIGGQGDTLVKFEIDEITAPTIGKREPAQRFSLTLEVYERAR